MLQSIKCSVFRVLLTVIFGAVGSFVAAQDVKPIADLPNEVKNQIQEGAIGLHVDWEIDETSEVNVWLVNRSVKPIILQHAYGNVYLKLEAKNSDGQWERTQVHRDEQCGTGLGTFELKPGMWVSQKHGIAVLSQVRIPAAELERQITELRDFMTRARLTKEGRDDMLAEISALEEALGKAKARESAGPTIEERPARIRVYDQNFHGFSNEGTARVNLELIEDCKSDPMALRFADLSELRKILNGELVFEPAFAGPMTIDVRVNAILALGRPWHPAEEATAILDELVESDDEKDAGLAGTVLKQINDR